MIAAPTLGLGAGWRPELAWAIAQRHDLGFVEVVAENLDSDALPPDLALLREAGVPCTVHGVALGLAGAEPLDPARVRHLARVADALDAPWVSEHLAFVRAGGVEAGHLLPPPRTRAVVDVVVEHFEQLRDAVGRPIALENIAAGFRWPDDRWTELDFVCEVLDRTGAALLFDAANLVANARNFGFPLEPWLERIPWDRVAYLHVAGGTQHGEYPDFYVDTHAHAVPPPVLELVAEIRRRHPLPGVLLERDDHYPTRTDWNQELDEIRAAAF